LVDEVAEGAFELQRFGGEGAGGVDAVCVFGAQGGEAGSSEGMLLAAQFLHFGDKGVRIEVGQGLEFLAGLFNGVFHAQPVEHGALRLLLAGGDVDEAALEAPIYLRLLQVTIEDGITLGCERLSLGRTALEPKSRLGAQPEKTQLWLRHRHPAVNLLVKGIVGHIPHAEAPERNPFK
jgi:hypothetical protein